MQKINRELFWANIKFARPLKQEQVDNINRILDRLDASEVITRLDWYAYILATIKHETAETYKPVTEYGGSKYLMSKRYYPYIGRGYVQLTWDWNYDRFGKLMGIDLLNNPELANDPETAWKILELGMTRGLYTGKKLGDYFYNNTHNWYLARKIINGLDRFMLIGNHAKSFYNALEFNES